MEKINREKINEFRTVEFMRKVRNEMTELYLHDRNAYLNFLKQAMENFISQQKNEATDANLIKK